MAEGAMSKHHGAVPTLSLSNPVTPQKKTLATGSLVPHSHERDPEHVGEDKDKEKAHGHGAHSKAVSVEEVSAALQSLSLLSPRSTTRRLFVQGTRPPPSTQ